jgi:small subunit ribosomal protein S8
MLTRIRNGQKARKVAVSMPASKAKEAVAKVLEDEGYITGFATDGEGASRQLTIELKYFEGVPVIEKIQRASRPGVSVWQ